MSVGWFNNPMTGFVIFLGGAAGLHWLGGRWGARGQDAPGKYLPYACGEDLGPGEAQLSYQRFFRLALVFVTVHMAALIVALLPSSTDARLMATAYLLGVAVCVDILVRAES